MHREAIRSLSILFLVVAVGDGGSLFASDRVSRLEVVDRAIEAHGGAAYQSSLTRLDLCSRSGCVAVSARIQGGTYELEAQGEVRGSNRRVRSSNDAVEWWRDGVAMSPDPEKSESLRNWVMGKVYFCFLPYRLNDDSVWKEDLGTERWGDKALHKVKVTFTQGSSADASDEYLYWFDPESGRIVQFAYSFEGKPGGLRFRRGFNYREVGGIVFFDQENWGVEGKDLRVDQVTPAMVERMELISTVTLTNIAVEDLE